MTETAFTPSIDNILAVWNRSTPADIVNGAKWYSEARALAEMISPENYEIGAGVIAALSPMMPWSRNVDLAVKCFAEGGLTGGCLSANVAKANRIMNGEDPLRVLSGDKVRAFFAGIMDTADVVCVDRHAFDIAVGRSTDDNARKILKSKRVYSAFSDAYIAAAKVAGVSPVVMQATCWVVWRNEKGIK